MKVTTRLSRAWNAFKTNEDNTKKPIEQTYRSNIIEYSESTRPDQPMLRLGTERSIIASIYNRIATDVSAIEIRHARVDQNEQFVDVIKSGLNDCLSVQANKDQTARAFFHDATLTMFEEGHIALVPIDTDRDLWSSNSFDIYSIRVGKVLTWYPDYVDIEVYNDNTGRREILRRVPKANVCLIQNPFYEVMNKPNSTWQRLRTKLAMLDATDAKQNSDKLNMIIRFPYNIRGEAKQKQAEKRREAIEAQLVDSKHGIAYIDSTEEVIQLGHGIENNLLEQINQFTNDLYAQLGLTPTVFNGTASEQDAANYNSRAIEPIIAAYVDEMRMKFLTKTARTQGQSIIAFRSPFSLVTSTNLSGMIDVYIRNEVLSSNEARSLLGYRPKDDPRADQLANPNINPMDPNAPQMAPEGQELPTVQDGQNEQSGISSFANMDVNSMTDEELQEYLDQLEAYDVELEELEKQVDEA